MSKRKYERFCPECGKIQIYSCNSGLWLANKRNARCKSCATSGANNPMYGKTGKANPFYGQHHTEKSKAKLRVKMAGRKLSAEHKAKIIGVGQKNIIQGDVYQYWLERFGKQEAEKRLLKMKTKLSLKNSGKGNPMYGKPTPKGSGNGWSGWYRGWFFRSLRELKYVLELDSQGLSWESAEKQQYKVQYLDHLGQERNYFPDFLVNNQTIVECKPKKLWKSPKVQAKILAARKHFSEMGLQFELIDPGLFDETWFKHLWESGIIKLTSRYERKAQEKFYG